VKVVKTNGTPRIEPGDSATYTITVYEAPSTHQLRPSTRRGFADSSKLISSLPRN
jgi:hypothetical protein